MNNQFITGNAKDALSEVRHLRNEIVAFSVMAQNDPAIGQLGGCYPFSDALQEFKDRSHNLLNILEEFPGMFAELGSRESSSMESAAALLKMAAEVKAELEWLEAMHQQLNSVLDVSAQELYQLIMNELREAVEAVLADIRERIIPAVKTALVRLYESDRVKQWRAFSQQWKRQYKEHRGLFAS